MPIQRAKNDFGIVLNTTLNTSDVPKAIERLQARLTRSTTTKAKIPIDIDTGKVIKDLDKLKVKIKENQVEWKHWFKEINTYKDELGNTFKDVKILDKQGGLRDEEITRVTSAIKTLSTETHKWVDTKGAIQTWTTTVDQTGTKVSTRVKEVVDDMGNIITTTQKLEGGAGKPFKKVGEDIVNVSELLKETTTETKTSFEKITDTVNGVTKTFDGTVTTIKKFSSNGEELTTVISKYTNDVGQAVEKTEQFNKIGVQVATTQRKISQDLTNTDNALKTTSKNVDIIKNSAGDIVKTIITVNEQGERLRTTITTSDNGLGRITTTTRVYNETLQKEVSLHQESINNQVKEQEALEQQNRLKQQLLTTTKQEEQIIARNGTTLKANVTTIKEQTHEYGEVTTKIIKYKDSLGNLVTETTKEDAQGRALAQSTKTVEQEMNKAADATNKMGNAAQNSSGKVQTLGGSFASALSQLTKFYLASLPLRAVTTIISETTEAVKEFDAAITEMGKVTDYQGEQLKKYAKDLGNLGKEVARTRTEMVEGATGWLKAGYSEDDAAQLAKYSALLQNTADEELSAADATSILVSQLKAYHMEAGEAIKITDIINKVSAEQAVSSGDIAKGLQQASSSMATFGNTIEQTTALMLIVLYKRP